jgi:predicted ferric reductase
MHSAAVEILFLRSLMYSNVADSLFYKFRFKQFVGFSNILYIFTHNLCLLLPYNEISPKMLGSA